MNLSKTTFPAPFVAKLADFNIREVGQLLAMADEPVGVLSLAELLDVSVARLRALLDNLRESHRDEVPPKPRKGTMPLGLIDVPGRKSIR